MFCKKCGGKNDEDAKFCAHCGVNFFGNLTEEKNVGEQEEAMHAQAEAKPENPFGGQRSFISKLMSLEHKGYLLLGCTLIIVAFIVFISCHNYFSNVLSGSRTLTTEYLESEILSGKIKDVNVNFQLPASAVYQAGYTGITKTVNQNTNQVESETTDSEYYITIIGDHLLVLEGTQNQLPSGRFYGVVIPLRSDLQQQLEADFSGDPDLKNLSSSILPYMVSNKGMTAVDDFGSVVFGIIMLLLGAYTLFRNLKNQL